MKKGFQKLKNIFYTLLSRRWRHRLMKIGLALLVVLFVLRALVLARLPWFLDRTLAARGFSGSYERLNLHLLSGDAELWHLDISPLGETEPLIQLEYCRADVSIWTLLRGELVIPRLEVDGLDIALHRNAAGTWRGLERLVRLSSATQSPSLPEAPKVAPASGKLSLAPPLKLDALRLQHVQVALTDDAVSPPVDTRMQLNLRLSNIGSWHRATRFQLTLSVEGILDRLVLEGKALGNAKKLDGTFGATLQGFYAAPVQAYLEQLGIGIWAQRLDAGFRGSLGLRVVEDPNDSAAPAGLALEAGLEKLHVTADNADEVVLDRLVLAAAFHPTQGIDVQSLQAAQGKVRVFRDPQGGISLAGLYLHKPSQQTTEKPEPDSAAVVVSAVADEPVVVVASSAPSAPGLPWTVGKVDLQDLDLIWDEQRVPHVSPLALYVESGSIGPIQRSSAGPRQTPVQGRLRLPGVFTTGELKGQCDLLSPKKVVDVTLSMEGLAPQAIAGYLDLAKMVSELKDAKLTGRARWSMERPAPGEPLHNSAVLRDVRMENQGEILAVLEHLAVEEIAWYGPARKLSIGKIVVQGEQTRLRWDSAGTLHVLGFAWGAARAETPELESVLERNPLPVVETVTVPASTPPTGFVFKQIAVDVGEVFLIHEAIDGNEPMIRTATLKGTVENAAFDPREGGAGSNGRLDLHVAIPGVVDALALTGDLKTEPPTTRFELSLMGTGLEPRGMTPYLKSWGIVPRMATSTLRARLNGQVAATAQGLTASLGLQDCALADANQTYIRLGRLQLDRFRVNQGALMLDALDIEEPMVAIQRDPNGIDSYAGLTFLPRPKSTSKKTKASPLGLCANRLVLRGGQVFFQDQELNPVLEAQLDFDINVTDVNTLTWDEPAKVQVEWRLPGLIERGTLSAQAQRNPAATDVEGSLEVTGLHPQLITRYLPEGSTSLVKRGRLALDGGVTVIRDPNGGKRWDVALRGLDYREVNAPTPWVHMDEAKLVLQTLDATGLKILVDEITVAGIEGRAARGADERLHALGFAFGVPREKPAFITDANAVVDVVDVNVSETAVVEMKTRRPVEKPLPVIMVQRLSLGVRELAFQDHTLKTAPVLSLQDFQLYNTDLLELLGENAASKPPVLLTCTGRVTPLLKFFTLKSEIAPLAAVPSLKLVFDVAGLQGSELLAWIPSVAERVDARSLTQGHLTGRFEAQATVARRRVTDFDFRQPFGVTLSAQTLQLTNGDPTQVLAGLEGLHVEIPIIDIPRRRIDIASIEVERPRCRLAMEPNGLRVLDLVFLDPQKANETSPPVRVATASPAVSIPATPVPSYRVNLNQFLISGLDLVYTDTTVKPRFSLPLNGLDLDVRGLSYPWPSKPSPVRFNVMMTSGQIGIEGQAGLVDQRLLFQEFTTSGRVVPGTQSEGWIKAGLKGLDLRGLRGLAGRQGIGISNGVLDAGVDVRIKSNGTAPTQVNLALTDLSLSESEQGSLSKALSLSVPLDVAIYMLQGMDGSIRLSLPFTIDQDGASASEIKRAAVGAATVVIGKAIARSPVKLVTGTGSLMAKTGRFITGTSKEEFETPQALAPIVIRYTPGAIRLDEEQLNQIRRVEAQLRQDKRLVVSVRHQLGTEDILAAERLANPTSEDRKELLSQLYYIRQEASRRQVDLASRTEAAYAAGDFVRSRSLSTELAQLEGNLSMLNDAVDNVLSMLGPGAQHLKRRRTRQGALSLGRARLIVIRDTLLQTKVPLIENRLQVAQPSFVIPEEGENGQITLTLTRRRVK